MAFDPPLRLDKALVALGLAESRARAQAMVAAGAVEVDGAAAARPSMPIGAETVRVTHAPNPWVSRAALKLVHALDRFALAPGGVALDIGASTGGFTEVLLARGAERVIAVDVGHGQLHPRLRADPRVDLREGVNARHLDPQALGPVDWVVADLSFISQTKALDPALAAARVGATLVSLIKPQFECGPAAVGKGGVVSDAADREGAVQRVTEWVTAQGWTPMGSVESPIKGGSGNIEFLLAARKDDPTGSYQGSLT